MEDPFRLEAQERVTALKKELLEINERRKVIEVKLTALTDYLAADVSTEMQEPASESFNFQQTPNPRIPKNLPAKDQVVALAYRLLTGGKKVRTIELLQHLADEGIVVGGADKRQVVSSILSRDDRFVPNRKEGWSLRDDADVADLV